MTIEQGITVLQWIRDGECDSESPNGSSQWFKYPDSGVVFCLSHPFASYRRRTQPRLRPWNTDEAVALIGKAVIRHRSAFMARPIILIVGVVVSVESIQTFHGTIAITALFADYEHSLDNGNTWLPCGVLESQS